MGRVIAMKQLSPSERLAILTNPYLRPSEVAAVIGRPDSTTCEACKRMKLVKHPGLGYYTPDVIKAFALQPSIDLWMAMKGSELA